MRQNSFAITSIVSFVSRIGSCSNCIRTSFIAAVVACSAAGMVAAFNMFWPAPVLFSLALSVAAVCTALFLVHVVVFGLRIGLRSAMASKHTATEDDENRAALLAPAVDRRTFLANFAKKAGIGMLTAAVTAIAPKSAYAYYICGDGTNGSTCSDDTICCFNNSNGHYYCCSSDSQCGTDGYCY